MCYQAMTATVDRVNQNNKEKSTEKTQEQNTLVKTEKNA